MKCKSLFAKKPNEKTCRTYNNLWCANNKETKAGRKHCEDLWKEFCAHGLNDSNFLTEFRLHTHQRWFEMYLAVSLKGVGLNVKRPPNSEREGGPDFLIKNGKRKIWVEAVCSGPGEEGKLDSVPKLQYKSGEQVPARYILPQDQIVLRLHSSLTEKGKKYEDYLEKEIVKQDDVLVVAINIHDVPRAWHQMEPLMMKALYAVRNLGIKARDFNSEEDPVVYCEQRSLIQKTADEKFHVQPFIDGSMQHIAAVLGSSSDMCNLPCGRFGDDFILFPNLTPVPKTKWVEGSIKLGTEWSFQESNGEWKGQKTSYCEQ